MNAIVAVDNNWGIGKNNDLLVSIPEDMKFFRETTKNKIVIMGKNTFYSLPNQKPLPNRVNIVISHSSDLNIDGVVVCSSIDNAIEYIIREYSEDKLKEVFFIGGGSIYKQCLDYIDTIYLTRINKEYSADCFFPDLNQYPEWKLTEEKKIVSVNGIELSFNTYKKDI